MPDAAAVPGANDWTGVIGGFFIWMQISSFLALLLDVEWEHTEQLGVLVSFCECFLKPLQYLNKDNS